MSSSTQILALSDSAIEMLPAAPRASAGRGTALARTRSQQVRLSRSDSPRAFWKHLTWPALGIVAVALLAAFFEPQRLLHSEPVKLAESQPDHAPAVIVVRPSHAATTSVVLPATVRPWQTTILHSRVTGYLTSWKADLGDQVKAGELLAQLETPELDQEVAEVEAQAREAESAAVQAQAERVEAEAELKVALAQLDRTKTEAELAKTQLARRQKLLATRAVSQDEYDTFQKQWEARQAEVAAADADVARRRTNLSTRSAIIAAREATARSRQANVDRLKELQAFKRIVAPFDGVVTQRTAEVGMLVTAGTEPLYEIQDMQKVRVQVNVPQANSVQVSAGIAATVSLPESAAEAVHGTVTRIAESVESTSRTMLAEIELDNAQRHFQPGSYAQVTLATPQNKSDWTIPTNTLKMQIQGPHVAILGRNDEVEIRPVTLGRNLGKTVIVTSGIRGDERLIVNPGDSLTSGTRVKTTSQEVAQR